MKALVKTKTVNEFKIEERPLTTLEVDEVLIKVEFCGVCGSDLHAASHSKGYEFVPKPIILGHELSGSVVELHPESNNKDLLGSRVVVEPGVYCNKCEQCLNGRRNICSNIKCLGLHFDGGMAEYVKVKTDRIHKISPTLTSEIAALSEPLAVAIHAVQKVANVTKKQNVLVQGCGIIGFFVALAAKKRGANVTISGLKKDWEYRLSHADRFGIETEIAEDTSNKKKDFDIIFECSGSSLAAETGVFRLKKGGTYVLVALYEQEVKFPVNILVRGKMKILTSYGSDSHDFKEAFHLLSEYQEQLKTIISIYPLEDGALAFSDAKQQKALKPIIKIPSNV
ncbi:zinc-dependent alcohol dehydrogenase [Peribacillus butanolivorans]|uniref:zinc-dependent alcohol dehydrogenase n=1 Tax=Peribacillus butanolivorans TaxID=421767 RepID=UPI0036548B08